MFCVLQGWAFELLIDLTSHVGPRICREQRPILPEFFILASDPLNFILLRQLSFDVSCYANTYSVLAPLSFRPGSRLAADNPLAHA